jgi:glycosyltransferase involved in cell wall biosynthesis
LQHPTTGSHLSSGIAFQESGARPLRYHIALSRPFDFAEINRKAQAGESPNHTMWELSQKMNATLHHPDPQSITPFDKIASRLVGQPEHWAMARKLLGQLNEDDLVFCTGEDIGLPIALLFKLTGMQSKLVVSVMAPHRTRFQGLCRLFNLKSQVDLFTADTQFKIDGLRQGLNLSPHQVYLNPMQTDVNFFKPGASTPKSRPVIASAGLEQRDYQTLAIATQNLDVDVKLCAVSPNASSKTKVVFPAVLPANMTSRHYPWSEFLQLYRDADVVVVSLLQNHYSAGLTTLVEALACRRPVVMTRTPGLGATLIDMGVAIGVEPGDTVGMEKAIAHLLAHPELAAAQAQRGYDLVQQQYTSEHYVQNFATVFQKLARKGVVLEPQGTASVMLAEQV